MAITREKLELLITGDARDAVAAMRQASGAATGLDDSVGASATKMSRLGAAAGAAGDHIRANIGMYSVAAVAGLSAAVVASIREFTQLADKVRDFSRFAGVSAETSSRLVAVFDDLEVSQESANTAFFRLNRGISSGTVNLEQYGAQAVRSKDGNLDIYRTLLSVADAYQSTADSGRRAELVQEAFGRGGAALIPILERGRQGIRELYENVPEGQILDEGELLRARSYELAMDNLQDSMQEFKVMVGQEVAPVLAALGNQFADLMRSSKEFGESLRDSGILGDFLKIGQQIFGSQAIVEGAEKKAAESADSLTKAQMRANEATLAFNALAADKKLKTDEGREATRELRDAQEDLERVTNRVNAAHEQEIDKLEQVKQSTYEVILQKMGLEGAQIAVERAILRYNQVNADSTATDLDKRDALLNATQATLNYAKQQIELEGLTTDSEAGQRRMADILNYVAGTLDPNNPLVSNLRSYADQLAGIPAEIRTRFSIQLDTGEINRQIASLGLSNEELAMMFGPDFRFPIPEGATGGIVNRPTVALIGEAGPEAVIPLSRMPGNQPLPAMGFGGGGSITIPLVVDGRVLAEVTASELNRPGGPVIKQRAVV